MGFFAVFIICVELLRDWTNDCWGSCDIDRKCVELKFIAVALFGWFARKLEAVWEFQFKFHAGLGFWEKFNQFWLVLWLVLFLEVRTIIMTHIKFTPCVSTLKISIPLSFLTLHRLHFWPAPVPTRRFIKNLIKLKRKMENAKRQCHIIDKVHTDMKLIRCVPVWLRQCPVCVMGGI
jgi:hypothetical protein